MKLRPQAPLIQDPIFDGPTDPVIIWNRDEKAWWILYTSRRSSAINHGVTYVHGSAIGVASSPDGKKWTYRGTLTGLEFEPGHNTFWAPEVLDIDGTYHMYVTYVQGIPTDWQCDRNIIHYTSENLWDWTFESILPLSSNRVIDACVYQMPGGQYKMWYKDEDHESYSYTAYSDDLYNWQAGQAEIRDVHHEGPNVFELSGYYWMITDPWEGLGVYRSEDGSHWVRRANILDKPGTRLMDGTVANHADVLVHNGKAYIFYFTHPNVSLDQRRDPYFQWGPEHRRTVIQVANLEVVQDELICERDDVWIDLSFE